MPAIAKAPRLHACVRAPCIGSLRVQGGPSWTTAHPYADTACYHEAPCPHAPHKRSHNGGLATKAQRAPSSHANVHALGAPPTAGVENIAQRRKIQATLPQKRSASLAIKSSRAPRPHQPPPALLHLYCHR